MEAALRDRARARNEAIPAITVNREDDGQDSDSDASRRPGTPRSLRDRLSTSRLKDKFLEASAKPGSSPGIQDRLFAMLFQQMIPPDAAAEPVDVRKKDKRSSKSADRPNFSLPVMSNNFRRFNARIGVAFVFQNRMMRLFSWKSPTQTLSFLAVYSFCCLDLNLLAIVPLMACLFVIMVPAFLVRHPPPPSSRLTDVYNIDGPASAPPPTIKPAPDMSKDFFRNMRDLQNGMEDFSVIHDKILAGVVPLTNFADERLSSTLFLFLILTSCFLFIASSLIPWRAIFLVLGWVVTGLGHPLAKNLLTPEDKEKIRYHGQRAHKQLKRWMDYDIVLDEAPEVREVEIFELQRHRDDPEWEAWVFSTSPYDPLSPIRISGDRPHGTRFFEDVRPPYGWEWSDKKWTLDLSSRDWVEERLITHVEVEMEGERWVYDIRSEESTSYDSDTNSRGKASVRKVDWEEGTGIEPHGEWRRRRWVRLVKRQVLKSSKRNAAPASKALELNP